MCIVGLQRSWVECVGSLLQCQRREGSISVCECCKVGTGRHRIGWVHQRGNVGRCSHGWLSWMLRLEMVGRLVCERGRVQWWRLCL